MDGAPSSEIQSGHDFYRPLIPFTLALAGGIAAGIAMPGHSLPVGAAVAVLAAVVATLVRRRRSAWIWPLLLAGAAGYVSVQPWLSSHLTERHVARFAGDTTWRLTGRIVTRPSGSHRRVRFVLAAGTLSAAGRKVDVCGRVRVTVFGNGPELHRGQQIAVQGRLRAVRNFNNPGGFDYRRWMAFRRLRVTLFTAGKRVDILPASDQFKPAAALDGLRNRIASQIDRMVPGIDPRTAAILQALIIGDRSRIGPDLQAAFNRAGVAHLLAISGLHIGVVAAVAFFLVRMAAAAVGAITRRGWTDRVAAAASLVPVIFYGLLAGMTPSTQRAVIMAVVVLAVFFIGRRHDGFNTLAVAALVILTFFPPALVSVSFQLSFAAVAAIIATVTRWPSTVAADAGWVARSARRLGRFALVSAAAILGTAPLVAHYFNQVSLIGWAVNFIAVPVASLVVVPAGIMAAFGALWSSTLSLWCLKLAAIGLSPIVELVVQAGRWPYAAVEVVTPNGLEVILIYLLMTVLLWPRRSAWHRLALAVIMVALVADGAYWAHYRFGRKTMTITMLDVGQGSAHLVQLPGGYTILVDGGGFADNSGFDVGRFVVAPYLWQHKIATVDLVVLSHPNSDHLNGLIYILQHFKIGQIWSNQQAVDTVGYRRWRQAIAEGRIDMPPFELLPRRVRQGPVDLEILHPRPDFKSSHEPAAEGRVNGNSLVLRIVYNRFSCLFPGDIDITAERQMVRQSTHRLASTCLMVAHHGSRSSSSTLFLQRVRPQVALISAGWHNRFHFPHPAVLQRLTQVGARVWRTDQAGAIQVRTDGVHWRVVGTSDADRSTDL